MLHRQIDLCAASAHSPEHYRQFAIGRIKRESNAKHLAFREECQHVILDKKGAADAKKGQVFTRLTREIVLAARDGGGDPDSNFRLGLAIDRARAQNMPKDNIERAIRRGTGEDKEGTAFEEVYYEGYAPHGIALMISCVTENRNRTVADVRHILNRYGGSLAEAGAVSWQFSHKAFFTFPCSEKDFDKVFELAVEGGADDVILDNSEVEIVAAIESFKDINDQLKKS